MNFGSKGMSGKLLQYFTRQTIPDLSLAQRININIHTSIIITPGKQQHLQTYGIKKKVSWYQTQTNKSSHLSGTVLWEDGLLEEKNESHLSLMNVDRLHWRVADISVKSQNLSHAS